MTAREVVLRSPRSPLTYVTTAGSPREADLLAAGYRPASDPDPVDTGPEPDDGDVDEDE